MKKQLMFVFFSFICINEIFCQNTDLQLNVINDSVYFQKLDGKVYPLFGYLDDSIFVDTTIKFNLVNTSKDDYCLLLNTSQILTHSFYRWENKNELRFDNNYSINAVIFDSENDSIIGSKGCFIKYDLESMDQVGLDSIMELPSMMNYNFVIIKKFEKLTLDVRFIVPYFEGVHYMNTYNLSNSRNYYLKFYVTYKRKLFKEVVPKEMLKDLRRKNIKLFKDDLLTSKKVPILIKNH